MKRKIKFYLPNSRHPDGFSVRKNIPKNFVDQVSFSFWNSSLAWNLQTYLRLREQNYPCRLVDTLPEKGIIVSHRADLPFSKKPPADGIFVATLGDAGWHPYAQVQIAQNPNHLKGLENAFSMHHWTQPGLIPRSEDRGDTFENVGYFGHPDQLAEPLHGDEWEQFLAEHDLNWIPVHKGSDRQSDYSDIDLIVAIRSFDWQSYDYKPATKLHNAWLAGVPAILGPESAYQAERRDELDYLEARTYDELREYVTALNRNPTLRRKLRKRSEENRARINPEQKAREWWELLTGPVQDIYEQWTSRSAFGRKAFIAKRWARVKRNALQERLGG